MLSVRPCMHTYFHPSLKPLIKHTKYHHHITSYHCTIEFHQASSSVIKPHQASSSVIKRWIPSNLNYRNDFYPKEWNNRHQLPTMTIDNNWEWLTTIDNNWWWLMTIGDKWLQLMAINDNWWWLTMIDDDWLQMTTIEDYWQWLVVVNKSEVVEIWQLVQRTYNW